MDLRDISSIVVDNSEYIFVVCGGILHVLFCVSNPLSQKVQGGQCETGD